MKKLLLVLVSANCLLASAQTKKTVYRKAISKTETLTPDSATIFYNLGWDFYKLDSIGVARYYWDKASYAPGKAASRTAAYYRLGLMQQNGEGVDTNLSAALDFYRKAAGNVGHWGNPDAVKAIAGCYENGFGVEQNFTESLRWYIKAKQAGNQFVDEDITRLKERVRNLKPASKAN